MLIVKALLRFLLRTRWSTLMALVGITLGITSIVSVHLVSIVIAQQMDALIPQALRLYDHVATSPDLTSKRYFESRRATTESIYPVIDEQIVLGGQVVRVIGLDLLSVRQDSLGVVDDQTDHANSVVWGGVWVSRSLPPEVIDELGMPLNGVLSADGLIVADIGEAQELVGWSSDDRLSYVGIQERGTRNTAYLWLERFFPGASSGLPQVGLPELPGFVVKPVAEHHPANSFGKSVLFNMSALSALALVVAWFLIYQVSVLWLRRLRGLFDRLFLLGVSQHAILGYFLAVILVLGGIATLAGIGLGQWVAGYLLASSVPDAPQPTLDIWVVYKAWLSAALVCILGSIWAYGRSLQPAERSPITWLSWLWLATLALVIVVGIVWQETDLAGAFVSIAAASLIVTFLIAPGLRLLKRQARSVPGQMLLRMSLREVLWFPRDLAIGLGGLSLAVATAIGVGLMIDSFRAEFADMLDRRLTYDYVVDGEAADLTELYGEVSARAEVRAQPYYSVETRVAETKVELNVTHLDDFEAARYGHSGAVEDDAVLIGEQTARLLGVDVGGELVLGGQAFKVAGVFKSYGDILPRIVAPTSVRELFELTLSGISIQNLHQDDLTALQVRLPGLQWTRQDRLKTIALETFDRTFVITTILITIAVLVAGIGIYIAVTVLRLNQRASASLLRSMGLSRWETGLIDLARGVGLGAVAVVIALPLGLMFGWILSEVVNPRAFGWSVSFRLSIDVQL